MTTCQPHPRTAAPATDDTHRCAHCRQEIYQVPGGHGSVWVHHDGYRLCAGQEVKKS